MKTALHLNEKAVYRVVNAGVLTGMVLLGGQGFLGTGKFGVVHLLTALTVLALSAGLNFMAPRGRILCLAALIVFFITGASAFGIEDSIVFVKNFFPWLAGREAVSEAWVLGYQLVQTGFLAGMCYLAQVFFEKLQMLKMTAGILTFLILVFCLFARRELNHYGVAFQLVFCVIVWMEWIQGHWKKERSQGSSREAHTLWIMPFLLLYLVLLAAMPAPEKPYDWKWAKNIFGRLCENILTYTRNIKWGSREGFGMAFSGFSEDGELRGGLQEESGRIMRIQVSRDVPGNSPGNIYLTGKVYDTFDGKGWYRNWPGYSGEVFLDTAETLYAVRNYNWKYQKDYLREATLKIRYEDFNTGYVFAPLKTWSVGADYTWEDGSLRWTKQKGYGTEYTMNYFRMNGGQQEFDRFLEEAGNGKESRVSEEIRETGEVWEDKEEPNENREIWEEVLRECRRRSGETITWDDVLLYRKEIYENYLGEVRLSSEVSSYLEEITRDAVTDMEKLRAVESALRSFSYTLTPGELPDWVEEERDFMDYFLLESRKGYCTYFATAFVLLARAEGIPARYVQGYCVPVPESGEAYVDSSMAHAWPEAYLKGVGWIPFEPTPGYGNKSYSLWRLTQSEQENLSREQEGSLTSDPELDGETEHEEDAMETGDGPEESGGVSLSDFWKFLGVGLPALLAVCAVVLAADHAMSRYRYRKMNPGERFRMEVFRNLEILSWLGVKKKEWETLQELRERAETLPGLERKEQEETLPKAGWAGTLQFMEDYEKIVYGGKEAGEDMLESAVQAREALLALLKKEKKWAYFYCRMGLFFGRYRA